jgi:hypothetical protein
MDVAPLILLNVVLFGEDCHCMLPVLPVKLSVVELPEHRLYKLAVAIPATETGFTLTVSVFVLTEAQIPLVTTAR